MLERKEGNPLAISQDDRKTLMKLQSARINVMPMLSKREVLAVMLVED